MIKGKKSRVEEIRHNEPPSLIISRILIHLHSIRRGSRCGLVGADEGIAGE
jgi:hypothetical protein